MHALPTRANALGYGSRQLRKTRALPTCPITVSSPMRGKPTRCWGSSPPPSNFLLLNPDAQKSLFDSNGESLRRGVMNLLTDITRGRLSQTDESRFVVGENLANTEGSVVFENDLIQLIQYKPRAATVYERPLLIVPPCINKFYILDLQSESSLVRHALDEGHQVYAI